MNAASVVVEHLVKRYPKRPVNAVDGVSFEVSAGEVFGLLGPNGAGKTTTVGVLTTRVRPTSGRATVAGIDVVSDPVGVKRRLAVVPQRANLDRALSARQNLEFHAAYFGISAVERRRRAAVLLEEFGLSDRGDDKVDFYSGGQSQRIMIARALMHEPEVLFLDEPTAGLDPQARLFVWDRIRDLKSRGVTMIITTHAMDEATTLCDRVGIMDRGGLLALDTPAALTATVPGRDSLTAGIRLSGDHRARTALVAAIRGLDGVAFAERVAAGPALPAPRAGPGSAGPAGNKAPAIATDAGDADPDAPFHVRVHTSISAPQLVAPVARLVTEYGGDLADLALGRASLEDVFIQLTGRALR